MAGPHHMNALDDQISEEPPTVWCAVLIVDLVESVRLIQSHEASVVRVWRRFIAEVQAHLVVAPGSRLVKHLGDGMLLRFDAVPDALHAAFQCHDLLSRLAANMPPDAAMHLRCGIHAGLALEDERDIYGHTVNLAARLNALALPGQVVLSSEACDEIVPGLHADVEDLGPCWLKHLDTPVRAWRARPLPQLAPAMSPRPAPPPSAAGTPLKPRVAVLDLLAGPEHAVWGALVADELASQLSLQPDIDLLSRLSTRQRPMTAGREQAWLQALRADFVLGGSCHVVGERVVARLELMTVATGAELWSRRVGVSQAGLLAEPSNQLGELAQQALRALESHMARRAISQPIPSLESYALLLGGVKLMHRPTQEQFRRSGELLTAVVDRAARHPDPHAWLARWHLLQAFQGWSEDPGRSNSQAHHYARQALDLDSACSLALTVVGMVQTYGFRQLDEGERYYRLAVDSNPNDALAWIHKAALHAFKGEGETAWADAQQALALAPLHPHQFYFDTLAASAALSAGEYAQAISLAHRSRRANAGHASTWRVLALAEALSDNLPAARAHVRQMLMLEPGFTVSQFLARAPGAQYPIGRRFADLLRLAGVPQ